MNSLREDRKRADDLLVCDQTPDGKGHRLVARFIAAELVKTTHTPPDCLRAVIGQELRRESKTANEILARSLGCPYGKLSLPMTNEVRHSSSCDVQDQSSVASVRRRDAEPFGTSGYFDNFRSTVRMRTNFG